MKNFLLLFLLTCCYSYSYADDATITANADLKSATVFRPGAELTHTAKATLKKGANSVTIEGLSSSVDNASIRITCSNGVTLTSFEFSNSYMQPQKEEAHVSKLKDSLKYYERELASTHSTLKTNSELLELLKANKTIGGAQNGTSVDELVKMMDYYKAKATELEKERNLLDIKAEKMQETIDRIRMQIQQDAYKNQNVTGVLNLSLLAPIAGSCDFTVTYYTTRALWNPSYDIQATDDKSPLKVACKAKILQTTGLDWKDVKLSLSTATPTIGQTAPLFQTWFLNFVSQYSAAKRSSMMAPTTQAISNSVMYDQELEGKVAGIQIRGVGSVSQATPLYVVNGVIMKGDEFAEAVDQSMIKSMNVLKGESSLALYGSKGSNGVIVIELKDSMDDFVTETENMLDVTYDIDFAYNVLTNGKEQSVTIRTLEIPASYQYYCAPKLDKSVYLTANVADWQQYNLLEGEANITFSGTYVGKSYIDPSSTKKMLSLTLGIDKRVVVTRELLKDHSSVKFLGSDKKQVFAYKLTVHNTKNTDIELILKDQYPTSTQKTIEVEVLNTDKAIVNEETGVATWTSTYAPGENKVYNFSYSVKYPKNSNLNL